MRKLFKNETFTQGVKYLLVGGACTILDFSLLYVLTHFLWVNYVLSSIVSFMSGTILNYFLCTIWIFKISKVQNRYHEFLYYALITAVGLGINTIVIWGLTEFLSLYFMLSKLLATFATYWWNFLGRKYFLHIN